MLGAFILGSRTSKEPLIKLKLGPQKEEVFFLGDSGAERPTVQRLPKGCTRSKDTVMVIGAKGEPFRVPVIEDVEIESETRTCLGNMLLVEEADYNLLGRDLMVALGINLIIQGPHLLVSLYRLTEDENKIDPNV